MLQFDGTPLPHAVGLANRYSERHIVLAGDLDALRVTGAFRAGDTNGLARALAAAFGLSLEHRRTAIWFSREAVLPAFKRKGAHILSQVRRSGNGPQHSGNFTNKSVCARLDDAEVPKTASAAKSENSHEKRLGPVDSQCELCLPGRAHALISTRRGEGFSPLPRGPGIGR